jgi:hypothetical protein
MKTKLLSVVLLISMGFIACKKESAVPVPKTTQEKIAGKWKLESTVTNNFYSGASHIVNYTGTAADYADFRSDGKIYSFVGGSYDTAAYGIISDTKMWIDNSTDVFDIQTLTDANLKIYRKETYTGGEYSESTINMKR